MELYRRLKINDSQVGDKFGYWTQVGPSFSLRVDSGTKYRYAVCECFCGRISVMRISSMRSCNGKGCYWCTSGTHRMSHLPESDVWSGIVQRCTNVNCKSYANYGGRGITICDRWRESFAAFYSDMGARPSDRHSIDRIDNSAGYSPDNCRWATKSQQARNTRGNRVVQFRGREMLLVEIAEQVGMPLHIIHGRLKCGWTIERAVETAYIPGRHAKHTRRMKAVI